eukprot:Selendium_serpulae@DN6094_c3_g1_i2.p1
MRVIGDGYPKSIQYTIRFFEAWPIIGCFLSAAWACMGEEAEAFRAFIWSLFGCIPILNLWRCCVVLIRCASPERHEESLDGLKVDGIKMTSWMSDERIQCKTFYELTIPGSHDSGAKQCPKASPYIESWTVCQESPSLTQCELGCRYFDIRITDRHNPHDGCLSPSESKADTERFWVSHRLLCVPLRDFVKGIKEFVSREEAQSEVLTISLRGDACGLNYESWLEVRDLFLQVGLKESQFMVRKDLMKTIGEISEEGKQILFLVGDCGAADASDGTEGPPIKYFIDQGGLFYGSWYRTNSQTEDDLVSNVGAWLDENADFMGKFLFKAQCELTPNPAMIANSLAYVKPTGEIHFNLGKATEAAHRALVRGLKEAWRGKTMNCFITHDFVRADLCEAIISINCRDDD